MSCASLAVPPVDALRVCRGREATPLPACGPDLFGGAVIIIAKAALYVTLGAVALIVISVCCALYLGRSNQ
jgi:hypothetical protein